MSDLSVQSSFNAGEWAPALYARVDLQKYRAGAALLENFFVDYRGGASTRPGTAYVLQAYKSSTQVRLIPFQASFNVGYVLEFGDEYIRFFFQGSPILETAVNITGASQANPCVLDLPGNTYNIGDWIFVDGIVGMTQLNGRYFNVNAVAGNNVTLGDLNGVGIDSTVYSAYISGGEAQRVYTIASPYAAADISLIKFAQSIDQMILCHPSYKTQVLTLVEATDWTLNPIAIGSSIGPPAVVNSATTLGVGPVNYSYAVTAIDASGEESSPQITDLLDIGDIRTIAGTNQITWTGVAGAVAYNVYESDVSYFGVVPIGVQFGFIGTTTGTTFIDSNIGPDFSQTPPVAQNPFVGAGINLITVTSAGTYTTVPMVTFSGGSPSIPATAIAQLEVQGTPTISGTMTGYVIGDTILFGDSLVVQVTGESAGSITSWVVTNPGSITSGSTPTNPITQKSTSGTGTGAEATATWGVGGVIILTSGAGYIAIPTVVFSTGAATATATLEPNSNGNPSVPSFFQQRLVLAAPLGAPQTFYLSQPGNYFNFNISDPSQATDAITGTLVSGTLNTIKSIISSAAGMLILTDKASWLVNGGSSGSAVSPSSIVANPQSFVGSNDVPPIVANYDILYPQSKGSGIRDLAYNIYLNVFTGTDISVLSSHLFFGYEITEWAWAEEPFYVVWAVRNDGVMLTLTFLKEQDFIGWSHHVTSGDFLSVATVTESTELAGNVDAVYTVVQRVVNGNTVKYIERIAERIFPNGAEDAWCVDAGLQYIGSPQSSFTGAEHLAGLTCTGLSDGVIIPPFVMPLNGEFTIPVAGSKVTVGLGFTCQLQTLAIDIEGPTVQGKVKKIPAVVVRVNETLNLQIGSDFNHLVNMKDTILGNVSSMLTGQSSQLVTGLYSGDARTQLDPTYTVPGQYCIQASDPYPATILGCFPEFVIGDTGSRG